MRGPRECPPPSAKPTTARPRRSFAKAGACRGSGGEAPRSIWSGRRDSNSGPPAPKAGALPGCATPRPDQDPIRRTPRSRPAPLASRPVQTGVTLATELSATSNFMVTGGESDPSRSRTSVAPLLPLATQVRDAHPRSRPRARHSRACGDGRPGPGGRAFGATCADGSPVGRHDPPRPYPSPRSNRALASVYSEPLSPRAGPRRPPSDRTRRRL